MKTVSLKTKWAVVGLVVLGAWGLWYLALSPVKVPSLAAGGTGDGLVAPRAMLAATPAPGVAVGAGNVGLKGAAGQGAAVSQAAINQAAAAQMQFATRLTGNQQISYEGRAQDLLGVNPVSVSDPTAGQMVTLQDRETGQLSYRLAGVRVVLVNPAQGDAFVAGNADMSRLFVNSQYLDAAVAPSRLAAVLSQLQADPRVARVDLMRYVPPAKPK
ncbi:MAG: hypothetical protein RJB34_1405 [Pseudomonadota bacterium]|jgi:hypothetical protein